ncbi:hypothetical protein OAM70_01895 [Pelagibacteraceae bacterium]|nr:hypothetical protein [Pelagibacteraceae bacterium]MDC0366358.1 hypothetical protein [Pelagibacteraceae bacterium]
MKKISNICLFIILLLPLNCGFKVVDKSENKNYSVKEIIASGDKRISYKIKNNLLIFSKETSRNELIIYVDAKKNKSIKEKNIKNEITKYQININVDVSYDLLGSSKEKQKMNFTINGDYDVDKFHSNTIINEGKLLDNLVQNITDEITDEIGIRMNDL